MKLKLNFRIIFFVFLFFFVKINSVLAGAYYEITSIDTDAKRNNIIIKGWAVAFNDNTNLRYHQVNPEFTLYVADSTKNLIGPIKSSAAYGAFGNSNINNLNATFFSAAYYYQAKGYLTLQGYWAEANKDIMEFRKKVAEAIVSTSSSENRILVNNHFEFKIPIKGEKGLEGAFANSNSLSDSGQKKLRLKLIIKQTKKENYNIYGQSINLPKFEENINDFVATKYVISSNVKQITGMKLETNYNKGKVTVSDGFMQRSTAQSTQACTCNKANNYCTVDYPISLLGGYPEWPWAKFKEGQLYTFYSRKTGANKFIRSSPNYELGMYGVQVNISSKSGNDCRVSDGSNYTGYLPAVWVLPPSGLLMSFVQTCLPWECKILTEDEIDCGQSSDTFYFPNDPYDTRQTPPFCTKDCQAEFDNGKVVFEDSTCTIRCNEKLYFEVDKPAEVISGMGLSYPVKLIGERVCKSSSSSSNCRNWFEYEHNKYNPTPTIEATIKMPTGEPAIEKYVKVDTESTVDISWLDNSRIEITNIEYIYNFPYQYLEPYTSEFSIEPLPGYIPHGHYFYIERNHPTGIYDINLKITKFGPLGNLDFEGKSKYKYDKVKVNCTYSVKNLHWSIPDVPASGIPSFRVRQVSLANLFPNKNRLRGSNWFKEEHQSLIQEIEYLNYGLYNQQPLYEIILDRTSILETRLANSDRNRSYGYPYSCFELDENEQSRFIRETLQNWVTINNR